jgi:predicted TIM-barrel fold metal-dependent hydrolase
MPRIISIPRTKSNFDTRPSITVQLPSTLPSFTSTTSDASNSWRTGSSRWIRIARLAAELYTGTITDIDSVNIVTILHRFPRGRGEFSQSVQYLGAAGGAAILAATPQPGNIPVIDTHIHLFDTERKQGVPWPPKENQALYRPALPPRYQALAATLGIVGAIEVECSPWLEDNQWVLDVAARSPVIVGTIGNLEPGKPEFAKQLERFHRNPLFRGIRYGNLWDRNFAVDSARPAVLADLKLVAQAGLVMDTANPDPALIDTVVRLTDRLPDLRVVVDHLPQCTPPAAAPELAAYRANLRELARRPQVYVKLSSVLRRVSGDVPQDLAFYRPRLDELYGIFGEDHVLFGSDWPNSDNWGPYGKVFSLVREYFNGKTRAQAEKYFWKNSVAAYRWVKREPGQPG